jgi:hypothetical protein
LFAAYKDTTALGETPRKDLNDDETKRTQDAISTGVSLPSGHVSQLRGHEARPAAPPEAARRPGQRQHRQMLA